MLKWWGGGASMFFYSRWSLNLESKTQSAINEAYDFLFDIVLP